MKKLLCLLAVFSLVVSASLSEVTVVAKSRTAVIVTADDPMPVTLYAVEELVRHIELATGVKLPVAKESAIPAGHPSRIFVGPTKALALLSDINLAILPPEGYVMRTKGSDLYIAGEEDVKGDPLNTRNPKSGTLFGVYELIERMLGVRWLWPGELGTYVPQHKTVVVSDLNEAAAPKFVSRELQWGKVQSLAFNKKAKMTYGETKLGFTREGIERYGVDLRQYLRRHRMGGADRRVPVGHHFTNWWKKYGEEHPEWFMLHENGLRGPDKDKGQEQSPMCVSNPELHRFIVDNWDGKSIIRLGEVDWPDCCRCPKCCAWDAPNPSPIPDYLVSKTDRGLPQSKKWQEARGHSLTGFYDPVCISDRYARFWSSIRELAAVRNPDVLLTTYIYYGYYPAPSADIKLGPHVYGEFVPWGNPQSTDFFPMDPEALEWVKRQWLGWKRTGIRLAYRPNYLHDGWVMPLVDTRQSGGFIKFAADNGMESGHFDTLTGQWATQGPKLYVHARLLAKPSLTVEEILDEYYSAFGKAAADVRAYFEYWEQYCHDNIKKFSEIYVDHGHRWSRFVLMAHEAFPPACFPPAEQMLAKAAKAVAKEKPEFGARVQFLRDGLTHAQLSGKVAACFNGDYTVPAGSERFQQTVAATRELLDFRRTHEHPYISDYLYGAAWREYLFWDMDPILQAIYGTPDPEKDGEVKKEDRRKRMP